MRVESRNETIPETRGEPELDLGGIGRAVVAHRNWVIVPTLLALAASTAFVNIVKPRYTAEARLLLETQDSFMPRDKSGEAMAQQAPIDPEAVGSQIQLVTSRDVARRAIKAIGLLGNPEFDPLARGMGAVTRLLVLAGLKPDPTQLSPEDRVLETYYEKLMVFSPTKTRVLTIEFQAHDADLAAKGANTIAEIYLDFQQEAKRGIARSAAGTLGSLVADLKTRVAAAESKAEEFRTQSGLLIGSNNVVLHTQQLGEVNTELSRARTSQADAQAKARLIREMIKQGRVAEIPDVANSDLVRRISEQRVTLRAQLALESRTLLPGHPRIKELNAQLADLDSELRVAADKSARTLENESKIAGARVENLQAALDQQKKVAGVSGIDEVKMRELDRAARQLKDELEATTSKYQEALAREGSKSTPADARVVSRALAPQIPSFPKKLPIIGFSTVAALALSLGLVVARQLTTDRPAPQRPAAPVPALVPDAREPDDISHEPEHEDEREDEARPVADAPDVEVEVAPARAPVRVAVEPAIAAAALDLARRIHETTQDAQALALLACDDDDDLGFSLAVARALSRERRTILVAMDEVTRIPATTTAGLSDLMAGRATFHETIHRDPLSRLHVLGAGAIPALDANGLWGALNALTETYDFVVVAASRQLDVEEATALSHLATTAAVFGEDAQSAARLAAALERNGVAHVEIVGAADERAAQSAA